MTDLAGRADPGGGGALANGTTFGRYSIVRAIGSGGMGVVYEAVHTDLRKRVAVKVLQRDLARDRDARTRFLREGEAAARVHHPHVVDVSDVGDVDGQPFLVMEFLEGEDLGARLFREAPLAIEVAVDILLPVLAGVSAGHAQGVIHRDLKPQNIFLARGWNGDLVPKVLDFGVSKLLDPGDRALHVTKSGMVCGTVKYMSPEQARGVTDIGPRSDQYALGLLLYECLTGRQAYPGDSSLRILHKVATSDFVAPRTWRADLPEALEAVVLRALALDPADRFDSLIEFGRALLPFASMRARLLWSDIPDLPVPAAPTVQLPAAAMAPAIGPVPATPPTHTRMTPSDSAPGEPTFVIRVTRIIRGRSLAALGGIAAAASLVGGLLWWAAAAPQPATSAAGAPAPQLLVAPAPGPALERSAAAGSTAPPSRPAPPVSAAVPPEATPSAPQPSFAPQSVPGSHAPATADRAGPRKPAPVSPVDRARRRPAPERPNAPPPTPTSTVERGANRAPILP
jgi:tRNA A-37 threonylcarbamoyl transferase component Bud32